MKVFEEGWFADILVTALMFWGGLFGEDKMSDFVVVELTRSILGFKKMGFERDSSGETCSIL